MDLKCGSGQNQTKRLFVAGSILTISLSLLSVAALLTVNSGVLATMSLYYRRREALCLKFRIFPIFRIQPAKPHTGERAER